MPNPTNPAHAVQEVEDALMAVVQRSETADLEDLQREVEEAQALVDAAQVVVDEALARATAAETAATLAEEALTPLTARATAAEAAAALAEESMQPLLARATAAEGRAVAAETAAARAEETLPPLIAQIAAAAGRVAVAEGRAVVAETQVATLTAEVDTLQVRMRSLSISRGTHRGLNRRTRRQVDDTRRALIDLQAQLNFASRGLRLVVEAFAQMCGPELARRNAFSELRDLAVSHELALSPSQLTAVNLALGFGAAVPQGTLLEVDFQNRRHAARMAGLQDGLQPVEVPVLGDDWVAPRFPMPANRAHNDLTSNLLATITAEYLATHGHPMSEGQQMAYMFGIARHAVDNFQLANPGVPFNGDP